MAASFIFTSITSKHIQILVFFLVSDIFIFFIFKLCFFLAFHIRTTVTTVYLHIVTSTLPSRHNALCKTKSGNNTVIYRMLPLANFEKCESITLWIFCLSMLVPSAMVE